ncbi:putative pentatricopeptide repeat-containing protein At5g08490 isoform X2 [Euphorbia lathyris]|uniref:putative pentatricopeptide repeat-containing protein At5g08490 isoform X2 n=1 Tax=Euphorbia lathyris TaxID=212925 RepID=UPI003313B9FE
MYETNSSASNTIISRCHYGDSRNIHDYQVLASTLKSCVGVLAIKRGKVLHSSIVKIGHLSCQYVSKSLLNMYAKCGALSDCVKLFGEVGNYDHDPVFWNILLSGYAGSRHHDAETLTLFNKMRVVTEVKPTSVTAAIILPVCARMGDTCVGKNMHGFLIKSGMETHTLVGNALVSMYAKCGLVHKDAYAAFSSITDKDVISWNAIIAGFSENKLIHNALSLFTLMLRNQMKPNHATIANVLPVCASLDKDTACCFGKMIHSYALRHELFADVSLCNAFVSFYLMIGLVKEAEFLFQRMELTDLVSWNAVISGYASNGEWLKALESFRELLSLEKNGPDSVTLETSVGNALVNFYAKCGKIKTAYSTFCIMYSRDLISWNSMLEAFREDGHYARFLELLQWMHRNRVRPDSISILTILHFCTDVLEVEKVKETHCYSLRCGLLSTAVEPTTRNAILDSYAKCGNIDYAFKVFQSVSEKKNVVTFNSMISGYVNRGLYDDAYMIFKEMPITDLTTWNLMVRGCAENSCPDQALCLFHELQDRGMKPDAVTIMSLLPACAQMASVHLMKQCHGYMVRACFDDAHLEGTLLDVYSKCGCISYAFNLFQSNPGRDLVKFTAMIGGYAMHGMGREAVDIFAHMLELGIKPDHVIITTVLSACRHAGLVEQGLEVFYSMEKVYGMKPNMEQYSCVVDLLARGGRIHDAYSLVTGMPVEANANVWGTLLGACRIYHEVELGRAVAERLFKLEANNIGNYVVLSNLFAADSRWDSVVEIRKQMKTRDLKKQAGCSWIEVEKRKNAFLAGDSSHPERISIYNTLSTLDLQMKEPIQLKQRPDLSSPEYC